MADERSYSGVTPTAEIEVHRLPSGNVCIELNAADRTVEWVVTVDEARHIASGIAMVVPPTVWAGDAERLVRWERRKDLLRDRELTRQIRERDGDVCHFHDGPVVFGANHRDPNGGVYAHLDIAAGNVLDNVVVSCRRCLSARGSL